jgi:hypothetical protein
MMGCNSGSNHVRLPGVQGFPHGGNAGGFVIQLHSLHLTFSRSSRQGLHQTHLQSKSIIFISQNIFI